ncbi:Leucine-rich repeat protein kinase family protein [Perilla frutescens var. hirtella]|nr:Leucine-rich repeat protein kinase family protein [Perilla frutescens var. hirtella]KAH6815475.1 Leucine-rich repeat protein kinase family protein [Perilla frutescens var. frutescens]
MGVKYIFSAILVYSSLLLAATTEPVEDKRALLDFINNIYHSRKLNWDEESSACSRWTGISCNLDNSRIVAVRLPAVGLKGSIPSNTLSRLSALEILSLRSNGLSGSFPADLLELSNLIGLHLESNNFQGPLPLDFPVWRNLTVLNLSDNDFNGSLPTSVSNMTHLTVLNLANNSFSGDIPDINVPSLQFLDLSNNNLTGVLPRSLSRFPASSFSGNSILLPPPPAPAPAPAPTSQPLIKHSSKFSESTILGIVIGSCVVAFVSIALLLIITNRREKEDDNSSDNATSLKKEKPIKKAVSEHRDGNNRLTFFEGSNLAFDLEDLLRASAEVLGKGTFGTTYKAALEDATIVAVKRLKEVVVGRKEFEQQMEVVGSIRNENVAPLRAYYYSKDEKLMVFDYYNQGSVSALLHAKRGDNRVLLDWETRLRIAMGAARGIAHIHSQSGGKLVHGNVKASNIFLNSKHYGCVSDLGLATLMCPVAAPAARSAGYRAPEVTDTRKVSQASDVYSYGVVLLELLTGKSPVHSSSGEEAVHLVRWVHSVVREEWTGEVFDVELLRYPDIEEEMVAMLQIGMSCVSRVATQRPKIGDVVRLLEEIRSNNTGNSQSAGTRSPGSTPALTQMGSPSVS